MKPNRKQSWRQRATLAGLGLGVMAFCATTVNAQYISTQTVGSGNSWLGAYWVLPPSTTLIVPPTPTAGNTFALNYNGTAFGNNQGNTRTRNPTGTATFPGDSLTLNTNTELRIKNPGAILNFAGPAGGGPGLILNGGIINVGDDGNFPITGVVQAAPGSQSYLCPGNNGAGGLSANARSVDIQGTLTGSGSLVIFEADTKNPQRLSSAANTFNGQWFVRNGWLLGAGKNSLGTNSITIDPTIALPFTGVVDVSGAGNMPQVEADYDLNSAGSLTIANGGVFVLHQNVCFSAVTINGTALTAGTHWYTNLIAQFPANIPSSSYGTITVQPYGTPPTLPPAVPPLQFTGVQWLDADVGGPTFVGSTTSNADGTITIQGGGSDIWNTSSQFHYHYAWAQGTSWDIIAQFQSFAGPADWSKVELLVDQANPAAGVQGSDPFIAMMDTQPSSVTAPDGTGAGVNDGGIDQWRSAANGNSDWKQVGTTPAPAYPNDWFRINRNGNVFTLMKSADGITWTTYIAIDTSSTSLIGQDNGTTFGTPWPNLVAVGVAVTAHNNTWTDPSSGLPAGASAVIGNLEATFAPATAPTFVTASTQVGAGVTNSYGCEGSLSFVATNNAFPTSALYPINYQWFKIAAGVTNPVASATNSFYTWLLDTSDNGAKYYCSATLAAPYNNLTTNSALATIGVLPGVYYTNGLKVEFFSGAANAAAVEQGNVPPANWEMVLPNLDRPGNLGNYYVTRVSGWFIPPTSDAYTFYNTSDDQSDLFLSTDSTMGNKVMIAQETGWCNQDQWLAGGGGGGNNWNQQCSTTFLNANGITPYPSGISLIAGHPYYIEQDHYQGTGGDCFCATYQTATMIADPNWANEFTNGTPSLLESTNGNLMLVTRPVTTLTWVTTPTNYTATAGFPGVFQGAAKSDSEFLINYTWYRGNAVAATTTATSYSTANTTTADNGATFYVVATTAENELSITSAPVTLQVAAPVLEKGIAKIEYWYTPNPGLTPFFTSVANANLGTVTNYLATTYASGANWIIYEPIFEGNSKANLTPDYTSRLTAYFYPPTTGLYDFYVNSDDQSDLFVSTDNTPGKAVMVAQETAWSNPWQWQQEDGAANVSPSKCSATWTDANGNALFANGIQMTAGQPYYVALIHVDTGGGNNCEATFVPHGNAAPANGTYSAMTGNLIASYVPRSFKVAFTQEPGTVTAPLGTVATLSVAGTTDSTSALGDEGNVQTEYTNAAYYIVYQWTKNGVAIPGATSSSYSFGPVSPVDSTFTFACQIRSLGYVNNALQDIWSNSTPANLVISGTPVYEPGFSLHEYYALNPGVAAIVNNTAGTPTWLMGSTAFAVDDTGTEIADNFSDQLVGFFVPQTTANYVFWMNSDDDGELFLSTDASASGRQLIAQETGWGSGALQWGLSAGNATQVRSDTWVNSAGNTPWANGIPLVAGQKYFMQAVHHQGGGGTYTCVYAMTTTDPRYNGNPASGTVSDIRGNMVGTYVPACTYVTPTPGEPASLTANSYTSTTFTAGGTTDSTVPVGGEGDWRPFANNYLIYQWYKNGQAVAGATTSAYTIPMVLPSDNGSSVYCDMRALGYGLNGNALWATSSVATLTVVTSAPPTLLWSAIYTNQAMAYYSNAVIYVDVAFSGPMNPVALLTPNNYVFSAGSGISAANILAININSNSYRQVELALNTTPHSPFTVTVLGMSGLGGGPALAGTTVTNVNNTALTCVDIGVAGSDPALPTTMYVDSSNGYTVQCEGSDIWGTADGFNFLYEQKSGDVDVVVRQVSDTHTSNWAKGGLMIRESVDPDPTLGPPSRNWNIVNDPVTSDGINAPDGSGYGANTIECNYRGANGAASAGWETGTAWPPAYPNAWLRLSLKRIGEGTSVTNDIITAYASTNGFNWTQLGQMDITTNSDGTLNPPLSGPVYVGICTTAHNNDSAATIAAGGPYLYINTSEYAQYNSSYVPITILPTLAITKSGVGQVTVSWSPAGGTLMSSPAVSGASVDWQPVGTANPATIPVTGTAQYFRVKYN